MSQHDFDKLLDKYLSGKCSSAEEQMVLEWYQRLIEESSLQLSDVQKQAIEQKIWADVSISVQDVSEQAEKGKVVSLPARKWYRVAIAACFILLVGLGIYWFGLKDSQQDVSITLSIPEHYVQQVNKESVDQNLLLSDGSTVSLQPGSSVYYPEAFEGNTRDVYLKGNAFFSVAHNPAQHFIVHTENGLLTEVLGTSFSIRQQQNEKVEVAVVTGRVLVYENKENSREKGVVVMPNQKAVYNTTSNELTTTLVEAPKPKQEALLPAASFVFSETPVGQVLEKLQNIYGIAITVENRNINKCHFTGDISKQSFYEQLDIICQSIQATYEIKGAGVFVKGNGCQ